MPGCVNDRAEKVLVPNAFLPAPMLRACPAADGPQRRLMLAVLEQSVNDYLNHWRVVELRRRRVFAHAAQWVESEDRSDLYCFANICDHPGLDAEYLRRGLRRWQPGSRMRETAVA